MRDDFFLIGLIGCVSSCLISTGCVFPVCSDMGAIILQIYKQAHFAPDEWQRDKATCQERCEYSQDGG